MSSQNASGTREAAVPAQGRAGLDDRTKKTVFSAGGVLGALTMSSCCIIPLAFFSLGVTGAWMGNLAALYPYKLYFLIPTVGFLAGGFYMAYRKPKGGACDEGANCVRPLSDRLNRAVLWGAAALVLAALAFPYVAPLLLES